MLDKPGAVDGRQLARSTGKSSIYGGRGSLRSPREALQPEDAPPPPRSPKRRRRPLVATASGLLSFIGIAAIALAVAWSLGAQRIGAPGPLPADKVVTVQPGADVSVVDQLADAGVIDNRFLMTATLWLEGDRGAIKSGEYMFKQSASLRDVIDLLVSGRQILHSITLPEGLTSEQIVDRLRENDVLVGDVATVPPEGTLMPDTYKFSRGTTRDQVIRSMQAEQKRVQAEVWSHRAPDSPIRSPFELLTLASIVEKETGRADERPRVAGVFVNRLARNMPLQSDPTIVYGLVGGKGTLGRGILRSEVEQKTPYNTYQITGLPPGPIANPGRAAMEAVANPSRTRDLYFVADGTGGHAFADTLEQHRLNVQRWRQIEKDSKDKLSPDATPAGTPAPLAPKANQRGALDQGQQAYGELDFDISGTSRPTPSTVTSFPGDRFSGGSPASLAAFSQRGSSPGPGASATYDELDVEVAGVKSRSDPATWDNGGDDFSAPASDAGDGAGSMQTFPVSPQQLAAQRSLALAYGLQPGGYAQSAAPAPISDAGPAPGVAGSHLYGKGRIIDASEGTALDPLRDKTYDLTTAKNVPVIKALPPVKPLDTFN